MFTEDDTPFPRHTVVTAAWINEHLRENLNYLARPAHGTMHAVLELPTATWTPIVWDAEDADPYAFHSLSTEPTRLTVPTGYDGRYRLFVTMRATLADAGMIAVRHTINDTTSVEFAKEPMPPDGVCLSTSARLQLTAGDYFTVDVNHDQSGSIVSAHMTISWIWEGR